MATSPNAQLTKLAIGIASVAAIAGISGKIAAQPTSAVGQTQNTGVAAVGDTATNTNTALGGPSAPVFSSFGDEDENEHEEHEHSFFGTAPTQPQSGGSGTFTQAPQQQQTRRTRSKHS